MSLNDAKRGLPVPRGRTTRLWHLGRAASGMVAGALGDGARALARGERPELSRLMLSARNGERLADRLSHLRGAALKLGQMLSMDGEDVLTPEFSRVLGRLRNQARFMPLGQLAEVLDAELGAGWQRSFSRFDFTPIAAASIGQVHAAILTDGRRVAVKVQYPGVRESIDSDIDNLIRLIRLSGLLPPGIALEPMVAEARLQLRAEADYCAEAEALRAYRERLSAVAEPALENLWVPDLIPELCSGRVLTLELADGVTVEELAGPGHPQALRDRVATRLSALVLAELFALGRMQTDPNFANFLYDAGRDRVVLLDFGAVRPVDARLAAGYRRLARAAVANDRAAVREAARGLGYLGDETSSDLADALAELILLAGEPLRASGHYDFSDTDLFERVSALGESLVRGRGFNRTPPPETLFLHRKMVGTFLLCRRLQARIHMPDLLAGVL